MASSRNTLGWTDRFIDGLHELSRTPVRFAIHLAVARLVTQWRSLLTIIAGTILSASIGALVPLYRTAIAQVGLTQRIEQQPMRDVHISSSISLDMSDWAGRGSLEQQATGSTNLVSGLVEDNLDVVNGWVDELVTYVKTVKMGLSVVEVEDAEPQPFLQVRSRLGYYDGWQNRVRVIDGRLPLAEPEFGEDVEVVIGLNVANEISGMEVDTVLILDQRLQPDGDLSGHPTSQPITARIVGIVAPLDDDDPFWMESSAMDPSPLDPTVAPSQFARWRYEFTCLTTRDAVYRTATDFVPDTETEIGWMVLFAHDKLPFSEITKARLALNSFDQNMRYIFQESVKEAGESLQYNYHTRLIDYNELHDDLDEGILKEYADEVELLEAPFGLLLLQVGALVLFFLMVTAALVRRGERREIAMLQSRGAWDSQIVLLRGIEALLICGAAVLIAPFLSRALLTALGPTIAETEDFPLPLSGEVFAYAGLAAGVTFLALMFTLRSVLKLPLILAGGAASRSEKQQWWQRYYLDAVLALVGLGALGLLVRTGSPLSDVNLGGKQADPLMLMAPALLFLALGSLALRFFPIIAAGAARVSAASRGLLSSLASWQLSREPVHYGRITFLLALAVGIGWFATSFRATLSNSHKDQAKYLVGTDIRFTERDTQLNANRARPAEYYMEQDDIKAASTAFRIVNANLSPNQQGNLRGTILAINPDTFGDTLYWRSDLGDVFTPRAPGDPPTLPAPGQELPIVPDRVGVWARFETRSGRPDAQGNFYFEPDVSRLIRRVDLSFRFLDANGTWVIVPVVPVEIEYLRSSGYDAPGIGTRAFVTSGWVYGEADLTALDYVPVGPLRLVSIFWEHRSPNRQQEAGIRLTLADMTLIDAQYQVTPFDVFAVQGNQWEMLYDQGATIENERARAQWDPLDPNKRGDGLYLYWDQDAPRTTIGTVLNYPNLGPIDAIVSTRVAEKNELTPSLDASSFRLIEVARVRNVDFRPIESTEYYPSLFNRNPDEADIRGDSFMIVDIRELMYRLNRRPSGTYYPDEVWLRLGGGIDEHDKKATASLIDRLDDAEQGGVLILSDITLAEELDKLQTDPLGLGLLGLMYLAFVMALVLSLVGLLTYAGLTAQARRTEFGVLRALGLSPLRVVGGLALEQLFVMGIGVLLGGTLGAVLADQVVPTLALGAAGENVIPPFVVHVEVRRLLEYALMMLAVLGAVLSSSLLLVRQLSLARTLRLGEE